MQQQERREQQGYKQEEAQAILRRALRETSSAEGIFSHEQLRDMAAELGVDAATLDKAAAQWSAQEKEGRERRQFASLRRREFLAHLVPYLLVNALLVTINVVTGAGYFWAVWPMLGWGIGIVSHGLCAWRTGGESFEKEFQQWRASRHDAPARSEATA